MLRRTAPPRRPHDQLRLLDVPALARETGVAPELIAVGSFPGRPDFHGLCEPTAPEVEPLWPERRGRLPRTLSGADRPSQRPSSSSPSRGSPPIGRVLR